MTPTVQEIRRYPVKAMVGESLAHVEVDPRGLAGDRWFAVEDEDGHLAACKDTRRFRRRDPVVGYRAATLPSGTVMVRGPHGEWRVGEPALDDELTSALGLPVTVTPEGTVDHQDEGQVSIVGSQTLRWCADHLDVDADPRRLRVNLVLRTAEPFEEEAWVGRQVAIGSVLLQVVQRIRRCRTIDVSQDGVDPETPWLVPLGRERDALLAVYASVVRPGVIRVGDEVALTDSS